MKQEARATSGGAGGHGGHGGQSGQTGSSTIRTRDLVVVGSGVFLLWLLHQLFAA